MQLPVLTNLPHFSLSLLSSAGGCFLLSLFFSYTLIKIGILDLPNTRSAHINPTPKSGGIGILLSFLITLYLTYESLFPTFTFSKPLLSIIVCASLMGIVGFIDDLRNLSWTTRILIQLILAVNVVVSGVQIEHITFPQTGRIELGVFGSLISVFWIIAFTNAFNFMDGVNGMTAGSTLIALITLIFLHNGNPLVSYLIFLMPFSILGFYVFNFPHGKLFMGDSGSQFLGFFLACLGLYLPISDPDFSQLAIPMLFLIFLFDTGLTLLLRLYHKKPVLSPHREFLFHLLNRLGWNHFRVSILYYFFALLQVLTTIWMQTLIKHWHILLFVPLTAVYSIFGYVIIKKAKQKGLFDDAL